MKTAKRKRSSLSREELAAEGDWLRERGKAVPLCWLPEPQERVVLGDLPGKPADGKLWFEGSSKGGGQAPAAEPRNQTWKSLPDMSNGPRDVRKGDQWLPWHSNRSTP